MEKILGFCGFWHGLKEKSKNSMTLRIEEHMLSPKYVNCDKS